jgi:hypothetical protein
MVTNVENVRKGVFKIILYFEEKNLLDITVHMFNKFAKIF